MPQVTIYVPQDLADALDRQRQRLNVSQVCAHALRQEVGKMEAVADVVAVSESSAEERVDELPALIERLRLEKQRSQEHADEVERAGKRVEAWLKKARYEQIKHFGELEPTTDPERFYAESFRLSQHEELVTKMWGRERTQDGLGFSIGAYRRAWHERVRAFWEQVKEQL